MASRDPFDEMEALRRHLDRAFQEFTVENEPYPYSRVAFLPGRAPRRYPLINLNEDKDNIYLEALAPGVDPSAFNVTIVRNKLTLSGEKRRLAGEIKPEAFHRSERASGKFVRSLELPVEVDESKTSAEYKNGILKLTLPKAEKAKPKQINVRVA
ncbi:MAG: Hsp20/alpha crystallin family protein [Candidatus Binatia bacterium]